MITLYAWDHEGNQAGTVEADPSGPLPARCTPTPPPGEGYIWRNGWTLPDLPTLQARLRERVTALRWQHETGGIDVGGVRVLTGIEDQNRIASVLVATPESVDFKAASGWVTLTLAELSAVAAAIASHVQACFTAERVHHEAIASLESVADALAYDPSAGWPVTASEPSED